MAPEENSIKAPNTTFNYALTSTRGHLTSVWTDESVLISGYKHLLAQLVAYPHRIQKGSKDSWKRPAPPGTTKRLHAPHSDPQFYGLKILFDLALSFRAKGSSDTGVYFRSQDSMGNLCIEGRAWVLFLLTIE